MLRHEAASATTTDRHEYTFKQKALAFGAGLGLLATAPVATVACSDAEPISPATTAAATGQTATETSRPVTVQPSTSEQATTASTSANQDNPNVNMMPTKEEEFRNTILAQGYTPDLDYAIVLRGGSFPNIGVNGSWTSWIGNNEGLAAVHGCNSDHTPNDTSMSIHYQDHGNYGLWEVNGIPFAYNSNHDGLPTCGAAAKV